MQKAASVVKGEDFGEKEDFRDEPVWFIDAEPSSSGTETSENEGCDTAISSFALFQSLAAMTSFLPGSEVDDEEVTAGAVASDGYSFLSDTSPPGSFVCAMNWNWPLREAPIGDVARSAAEKAQAAALFGLTPCDEVYGVPHIMPRLGKEGSRPGGLKEKFSPELEAEAFGEDTVVL